MRPACLLFAVLWVSLAISASFAVVTDEETCQRLGAPTEDGLQIVSCAWTKNVLEDRFLNNSCEPSEAWLLSSSTLAADSEPEFCDEQSADTCFYTGEEHCLVGEAESDGCYLPPLQILSKYTKSLANTFTAMYKIIESIPARCASITNNITCTAQSPQCEWVTSDENQFKVVRIDATSEQTPEIQSVAVVRELDTVEEQIQTVQLEAAAYNTRIVTLSITDLDISKLDMGSTKFRLTFNELSTDYINADALPADIDAALRDLQNVPDTGLFTVENATEDENGYASSWIFTFDSASNANLLDLGEVQIVNTADGPPRMNLDTFIITRHRHNMQRVTLYGNGPIIEGEFVLRYTIPTLSDPTTAISDDTARLAHNATPAEVRDALLQLTRSGEQLITFVGVSFVDYNPDTTGLLQNETVALRSWNITFVGEIEEYELGEFELLPGYNNLDPCSGCTNFTVEDRSASEALTRMTVELVHAAPKIHGYFHTKVCKFLTALPGRAMPVFGSFEVPFLFITQSTSLTDAVNAGDYVRISGDVYMVANVSDATLVLAEPFSGFTLTSTVSGAPVHKCKYTTDDTYFSVSASAEDVAAVLKESFPGAGIIVTATDANSLGERQYDITFTKPDNSLDPVEFVSATGYARLMSEGAAFVTNATLQGTATVHGTFRLAFSGYDGTDERYTDVLPGFALTNPYLNTSSYLDDSSRSTRVYYTRLIPWNATAAELKSALEDLGNIITNGVSVTREEIFIKTDDDGDEESETTDLTGLWRGYMWNITFHTDSTDMLELFSADELEELTADIPQLAVADISLLYGSYSQVFVQTVQDGNGTLFQVNQTLYTENARDENNSPCRASLTYRNESLIDLGIDADKIQALDELDANMRRCSTGFNVSETWNNKSVCELVQYTSSLDSTISVTYSDEGVAQPGYFCIWRGSDTSMEIPANVSPELLRVFNWDNITYGGATGITRNSNCTVPLIYRSQQIVKLFSLTDAYIEFYEGLENNTWKDDDPISISKNLNVSSTLSAFIEQFNICYEDLETVIQLPVPTFVRLWQEIITFTVYTVGLAYGMGGFLFTWRMRSFNLLSAKSIGSMILIVFGFMMIGGIIGFTLGAIPAAIIFNIYSAIPYNLPGESAISLGIAQGLIILYFDAGRGLRMNAQ
mmetsp:Transcript_22033/g.43314  ORF Transcript_22033/g.43314 Transcript_22033/m.43314 type:complete len:1156 (-) Transcript_22033:95-3562(-)